MTRPGDDAEHDLQRDERDGDQHDPGDEPAAERAEREGSCLHVMKGIRDVQAPLKGTWPAAPEEEGGAAGRFVFDRWESVVGLLEVREARVAARSRAARAAGGRAGSGGRARHRGRRGGRDEDEAALGGEAEPRR